MVKSPYQKMVFFYGNLDYIHPEYQNILKPTDYTYTLRKELQNANGFNSKENAPLRLIYEIFATENYPSEMHDVHQMELRVYRDSNNKLNIALFDSRLADLGETNPCIEYTAISDPSENDPTAFLNIVFSYSFYLKREIEAPLTPPADWVVPDMNMVEIGFYYQLGVKIGTDPYEFKTSQEYERIVKRIKVIKLKSDRA